MSQIGRRRFMLLLAGSTVGAQALVRSTAAASTTAAVRPARPAPALQSVRTLVRGVVRDAAAARRIGRSYLSTVPDEADARTLLEALAPAGAPADEWWTRVDPPGLVREVRRRARADFRSGDTVELDGWFLSRVEPTGGVVGTGCSVTPATWRRPLLASSSHARRGRAHPAHRCRVSQHPGRGCPGRTVESAAPQQRAWTGDDAPSLAFTSFVSFYEETFAPMVRLAVLLTGAPSMAEDLVHDSYARVYSHWSRVREPRAYLRRAVINACRSAQRRAVRQRRLAARHTAEHARLDADELFDVLSDLPYRQRAAIVLKYYEGRSNPEIAELLGCRVGTVASLVHRGTEQLRRVIQP